MQNFKSFFVSIRLYLKKWFILGVLAKTTALNRLLYLKLLEYTIKVLLFYMHNQHHVQAILIELHVGI